MNTRRTIAAFGAAVALAGCATTGTLHGRPVGPFRPIPNTTTTVMIPPPKITQAGYVFGTGPTEDSPPILEAIWRCRQIATDCDAHRTPAGVLVVTGTLTR